MSEAILGILSTLGLENKSLTVYTLKKQCVKVIDERLDVSNFLMHVNTDLKCHWELIFTIQVHWRK